MSECCFCKSPIAKLTPWYFWDTFHQIVICEDLHPRQFKYRILAVPYGPKWHKCWIDYTDEETKFVLNLLDGIVKAHEKNGKGKCVGIDTKHFSIMHGHCQACIR